MRRQKNHFQDYKDLLKPPREGDIIKGIVIGKDKEGVFLDLKKYKTGIIKKEDLRLGGKNISKLKIGEELNVKIIGPENNLGIVPVSLKKATEDIIWQDLQKAQEEHKTLSLKVASVNKGGLMFNVFGISGFLPVSQLSKKNYPKLENPTPDKVFQELKKFLGKEIKVKIITIDRPKKKLILKEV